ncbi:hypothetical protein E8E13_005875 [Curvularia kusanoi]|uniref:Uncharacterized protein n=1 Tax=Curvularia kusanoi TaxID=90978 RepID=A0A9P4W5F2_CURKU|nr:hypothetical protein E8E13_005875 [Curvularia kusanoi]
MTAQPDLSTAWSKSHKHDTSKLSFLDLPRELRDLVYAHALHVTGAVFVYTHNPYQPNCSLRAKCVRYKNRGPAEPQPLSSIVSTGLLQTCKQLHAEACPVFYSDNVFLIWLSRWSTLALGYRQLIRHVIINSDSADRIFGRKLDLDAVSHGWKFRFWPRILDSSEKMLEQFPNVESLYVPLKSGAESSAWRPAFFALGGKTAERRVELAAEWMLGRSPLTDERVRDCLHLELEALPGSISREEYAGSRFAPDDEEWDYAEFEHAFELMKAMA